MIPILTIINLILDFHRFVCFGKKKKYHGEKAVRHVTTIFSPLQLIKISWSLFSVEHAVFLNCEVVLISVEKIPGSDLGKVSKKKIRKKYGLLPNQGAGGVSEGGEKTKLLF